MAKRYFIAFVSIAFLLIFPAVNSYPQYYRSYEYAIELAKRAFQHRDFKEALHYFNIAQLIRPDSEEPLFYINFIKRIKEGSVRKIAPPSLTRKQPSHVQKPVCQRKEEIARSLTGKQGLEKQHRKTAIEDTLESWQQRIEQQPPQKPAIAQEFTLPAQISSKKQALPELSRPAAIEESEAFREQQIGRKQKVDKYLSEYDKEELSYGQVRATAIERQKTIEKALECYKDYERDKFSEKETVSSGEISVVTIPTEGRSRAVIYPKTGRKMPETAEKLQKTIAAKKEKVCGVRKTKEKMIAEKEKRTLKKVKTIVLTDELRLNQPVIIELRVDKTLVVEGKNIKRFLAVSPEFVDIERVDSNTVTITGKGVKGFSFVHLWDDRGRWTLRIIMVFPTGMTALAKEKMIQESVQPFEFAYSMDWSSYYRGNRIGTMNRENLLFTQWMGIYGETPYGMLDASMRLRKFTESTEITSYTIGLTDAAIGEFRDFNLRIFDLYESFSPLSLPGEGLRGALLQARAFHDMLAYSLVWGREKVIYGSFSSSETYEEEAFIGGVRLTLFPDEENNYSLNLATGYGSGREDYLTDTVVSLEANQQIGDVGLRSELAFDDENFAATINSEFKKDDLRLALAFRDIEKDFTTITGRPANTGEIGATISADCKLSNIELSSNLDVYRDKVYYNPGKPDALNFDWDLLLYTPLPASGRWRTSFYYRNTPGLNSPMRSIRIHNVYSKTFEFLGKKDFSLSLGNTYQKNRYTLSPSSSFDRHGLFGGLRFPLIKNLSYYLNYEYSWVKDYLSGEKSSPRVATTGLSYYKQISPSVTGNMTLSYRNEENTEGANSFLAGEDSLDATLGITYRPSPDFEFFLSGSMRNSWAEKAGQDAYNDATIRWGIRSSWDLPFSWNPKGYISGFVFRDLNGNMKKDSLEPGIPDVTVKVGKKELITDSNGEYNIKVKAKKVLVAVDAETIPADYVFSTSSSKIVEINNNKTYTIDFGLTTQSGIYGIVFYDANGNKKPDPGDDFISSAGIILDGADKVFTDSEGVYFFRDIIPGQHTIKIDINSLPIKYIPLVKLRTKIELQEGITYVFHIPLRKK